jgi:hypothetical protein
MKRKSPSNNAVRFINGSLSADDAFASMRRRFGLQKAEGKPGEQGQFQCRAA